VSNSPELSIEHSFVTIANRHGRPHVPSSLFSSNAEISLATRGITVDRSRMFLAGFGCSWRLGAPVNQVPEARATVFTGRILGYKPTWFNTAEPRQLQFFARDLFGDRCLLFSLAESHPKHPDLGR
jgi:hypothetical protein